MIELQAKVDSTSFLSGNKSQSAPLTGNSSMIVSLMGSVGNVPLTGQMSPYILLIGAGAWTINLQSQSKRYCPVSGNKNRALFKIVRSSSSTIQASNSLIKASEHDSKV